jgi:predicted transposase YdaD
MYDEVRAKEVAREEGREEGAKETKLENAINIIKEINFPLSRVMSITRLQEDSRERLVKELTRMNIAYTD